MLDQPQSVSSVPGNQLQRQWCKAGIAAQDLILTGDPPQMLSWGCANMKETQLQRSTIKAIKVFFCWKF